MELSHSKASGDFRASARKTASAANTAMIGFNSRNCPLINATRWTGSNDCAPTRPNCLMTDTQPLAAFQAM